MTTGKMGAGNIVVFVALVLILIFTGVWAIVTWSAGSDVPMSGHGWLALGLGTFFSLAVGCGLMALMFYSSRSGYDDVANPDVRGDGHDNDIAP